LNLPTMSDVANQIQREAGGPFGAVPRDAGSLVTALAEAHRNVPATIGFQPPLVNVPDANQFLGRLPADRAGVRSSPSLMPTADQRLPSSSTNTTNPAHAAPTSLPVGAWSLPGLMGLAGVYTGGGVSPEARAANFGLDPATMADVQNDATRELLATNNSPASAQTLAQYQSDAERDAPYILSPKYRRLAQIIHTGEGNYESYNTGTKGVKGGKVGHSFLYPPDGTVTEKRIIDILATYPFPGTNRDRLFAVGAYQITPPALKDAFASLKLTGNELMNSDMQDRIFAESLVKGALKRYMDDDTGGAVDQAQVDRAQYAAARQWASIAVPKGYPTGKLDAKNQPIRSDGKMSYYSGPANSAHMAATRELRAFLEGLRRPAAASGTQRLPPGGR
jgi:hypothetical protein